MFAVSTHQQIMSLKIESQKRNEEEDQLKESEPSIKIFFFFFFFPFWRQGIRLYLETQLTEKKEDKISK